MRALCCLLGVRLLERSSCQRWLHACWCETTRLAASDTHASPRVAPRLHSFSHRGGLVRHNPTRPQVWNSSTAQRVNDDTLDREVEETLDTVHASALTRHKKQLRRLMDAAKGGRGAVSPRGNKQRGWGGGGGAGRTRTGRDGAVSGRTGGAVGGRNPQAGLSMRRLLDVVHVNPNTTVWRDVQDKVRCVVLRCVELRCVA